MDVLRPAAETEKSAFRPMLDAYLMEHAAVVDPDGRFDPLDFPTFDQYWTEPDRRAFWIMDGTQRAGLALVSDRYAPSGVAADHGLVEFYVVPELRRGGLGRRAAVELFTALPGWWELAVSHLTPVALAFWPAAIAAAGAMSLRTTSNQHDVIHRFRIGDRPPTTREAPAPARP
ncbi:MAG: hypothetical protein ACHP84_07780 [Caulobacterales bacterium]